MIRHPVFLQFSNAYLEMSQQAGYGSLYLLIARRRSVEWWNVSGSWFRCPFLDRVDDAGYDCADHHRDNLLAVYWLKFI